MKLFRIDPVLAERFRKFRKMRRAYWSLIILVVLFLLSLPAPLFFNDVPLVLRVDNEWYFPAFKDYTYKDFGGARDLPIRSYTDTAFQLAVARIEYEAHEEILFGDNNESLSDTELIALRDAVIAMRTDGVDTRPHFTEKILGEPREITFELWAPIRHSYSSSPEGNAERQTYMPPIVLDETDTENPRFKMVGVTAGHLLGTDGQGKDVLARIVYGFRISLIFGLALAFSGALVGTILGALQGYFGGMVDLFGQRATEIWESIPQLLLLMILSKFMTDYFFKIDDNMHYLLLFGILSLTAWMGIATYMRAEFLRARNLEYVRAAQALGLSNLKIMWRHILPNSLTPLVTFLPFNISAGILALVSLDFLGFGVKYPAPSLGELLLQGQQNLSAWWIILPTFFVLAAMLILLTFIGEGVRNAFDPRAKG